ncbi:magnesium transporter [archaeon]|nr:MAG: magnesium transporter [archaeon]
MASLLRQRKEKVDVEEGGGDSHHVFGHADLVNRNAELETLVDSMRSLLDLSRRREKKCLALLQEAGLSHGSDVDDDDSHNAQHSSGSAASLFWRRLLDRATWLVGLLVFQSVSSYILSYNEQILQRHPCVVFFLTMLVGAGGNAGNQATVRAIRNLATGSLTRKDMPAFVGGECLLGVALSCVLGVFGYLRVYWLSSSSISSSECTVIVLALMCIVCTSVLVGSVLPLLFYLLGIDPANASTTIQVVMDISGVLITCAVASSMLLS